MHIGSPCARISLVIIASHTGRAGVGSASMRSRPPSKHSSPARTPPPSCRELRRGRIGQAFGQPVGADEGDGARAADRATLLIAKLDRLSRDAHFLLGLQKAGVRFVAADIPEANELVVGIMAVIAQAERKMISTRTRAALAEARKRVAVTGQRKHPDVKRLGCPTGAAHLQGQGFDRLAVQALKAKADERAAGLAATLNALKAEGITSANRLAGVLNARGYATARGGRWTARSVLNVTARLA